jgi:hypothetical protein
VPNDQREWLGYTCTCICLPEEAGDVITARLKANLAGHKGEFTEAHKLDIKTAKKMPKISSGGCSARKRRCGC